VEVPDARRLIEKQRLTDLHASGWFENIMYFTEDPEAE
jgi:hypothetical protein